MIRPMRRPGETGPRAARDPARPRKGEGQPTGAPRAPGYRFNWNAPFILSHHNQRIFYAGAQYVLRSLNRGDDLRVISPELTLTKRGSATALAESPRNPDVLWAGTDDGALWVTRDGGKEWVQVTKNVGLPQPRWVSTIEPSRFQEGRCYVAFDGHRSDDDRPYLYVTEDYGKTWRPITGNLPEFGSTRVLREDIANEGLLYCGTEFALFVSLDRGATWTKLNNNLPTVAIHEIAIHPTAGEVVAATHGRSLWVLDVTALRQAKPELVRNGKPNLFRPLAAERFTPEPVRGRTNRRFVGRNPEPGAQIWYSLPAAAEELTVKVLDVDGKLMRELRAPRERGLHRVSWDMTEARGPAGRGGRAAKAPAQPPPRPAGPGAGFAPGRPVPSGTYRVVLSVDGQELTQTLKVVGDPVVPTFRFGGGEGPIDD
jgi:hypothetical protein